MKTKQDIIDEILASRLTANDIHLFSERMIPMTQCHDLLRSGKMSVPTALLLRGYSARVGSDAVDEKKKSIDSLVMPEIGHMAAIRGDFDKAALASLLVPTPELQKGPAFTTDTAEKVDLSEKKVAKKSVAETKKSIPSLKNASEIPAKPVVKIETTAWDSLPEAKSVGCRYYGNMAIVDINDTESYIEVGEVGYKVQRAWPEFSVAGVRFERNGFRKK